MALLVCERARPLAARIACLCALAFAVRADGAAPSDTLNYNFGTVTYSVDGDTLLATGVTITQPTGTLIRAQKAEGIGTPQGYDDSRWNLSGKVHIEFDDAVLDADAATVVFASRVVKSIDVQGMPARFSRPGKAGQHYRGSADAIAFAGARRQVRFTGNVWFSFGPNEGNSTSPLVYDIGQAQVWNEKGPAGSPTAVTISEKLRGTAPPGAFDIAFDEWKYDLDEGSLVAKGFSLRQGAGTSISAGNATGSGIADSYENSHWTLAGRVHIEHDSSVLDADTASVSFAARQVKSMDLHGSPARFFHPGKVQGKPYRGTAQSMAFDGPKQQVRFTGHSSFSWGVYDGVSDNPMVYDIDKGEAWSEKTPGAPPIGVTVREKQRVPAPRTPDRGTAK